jgi:hypothetical protein
VAALRAAAAALPPLPEDPNRVCRYVNLTGKQCRSEFVNRNLYCKTHEPKQVELRKQKSEKAAKANVDRKKLEEQLKARQAARKRGETPPPLYESDEGEEGPGGDSEYEKDSFVTSDEGHRTESDESGSDDGKQASRFRMEAA